MNYAIISITEKHDNTLHEKSQRIPKESTCIQHIIFVSNNIIAKFCFIKHESFIK